MEGSTLWAAPTLSHSSSSTTSSSSSFCSSNSLKVKTAGKTPTTFPPRLAGEHQGTMPRITGARLISCTTAWEAVECSPHHSWPPRRRPLPAHARKQALLLPRPAGTLLPRRKLPPQMLVLQSVVGVEGSSSAHRPHQPRLAFVQRLTTRKSTQS